MTTMVAPARQTASGSRGSWRQAYVRRLVVIDVAAVTTAVAVSSAVWVQGGSTVDLLGGAPSPVPYLAVSVVIALAWIVSLGLFSSRDVRVVGSGTTEYRRVAESSLVLFGVLAIGAYVGGVELGRAYLITCFLVGVFALMLGRWAARQHLRRQQAAGLSLAPVIVVGDRFSSDAVSEIAAFPGSGFRVVGVVSDDEIDAAASRIGRLDDLQEVIDRISPEAVIVTSVSALGPERMRQLSWQLAKSGSDLIVAPGLAGIAGPRVLARPVADLPLLRIEYPELVGARALVKRAFDVLGALALIVLSAPVMAAVAVAVALTSPGGIFYRQERVGQRGVGFDMLKFRSMRADSDAQLQELLRAQGTDGTPLFKVRNDPRVTAVGRFIRKYSLDELPQFFNVLCGSMSLVGPRPQRAEEVALYEEFASRRHIVKPGVSGLWQVSGRSTLAWEDAIRLDLSYVDNWSLTGDIIILWRTMRAVVRPGAEAY